MSQEITIIVKVDIEAAIANQSLRGNIYLVDNLRTAGSTGQGTDHLTSYAKGFYWSNGGQASEQLINWLPTGIASPPITVPESVHVSNASRAQMNITDALKDLSQTSSKLEVAGYQNRLQDIVKKRPIIPKIRDLRGKLRTHHLPLINQTGELFDQGQELINTANLAPIITNISGEAVDKKVIYPAQYGTPISLNSGWYWSASVDTNLAGKYSYTMHILLHHLIFDEDEFIWEPVLLTHDAYIEVVKEPKRNGFTCGATGQLPVV